MSFTETWLIVATSIVSLQLVVILMIYWRAKRTGVFIGAQFELLFWLSFTAGVVTPHPINLDQLHTTTIILYCSIRSLTLAAIFLGNPDHGRDRWSYLFQASDKNEEKKRDRP